MNSQSQNSLPDIRQTSIFNAPIQKVWAAVATAEGIAAWFMPNDFLPIVGHEFQLNAGPFGMSACKVTEINPPHRVSFMWGRDWAITFELAQRGDQTEFTLIHSGWVADSITEFGESHQIVRDRMSGGWVGLAKALAKLVEA